MGATNDAMNVRMSLVLKHYLPKLLWSLQETAANGVTDVEAEEWFGAYLFCDMCRFTSFAENRRPSAVVFTMNVFFEEATDIIGQNEGDIERFLGDGFFAVFEEPYRAAVAAAQICQRFRKLGLSLAGSTGGPLLFRMGLHAGDSTRSSIGGRERKDFCVLGDAVNIASRLESACVPGRVLVSKGLVDACGDRVLTYEPFRIALKGRQHEVEAGYLWKVKL